MDEKKMYVTGDTHGDKPRMTYRGSAYNKDLKEDEMLFICGDFGYVWDGSPEENAFLDFLSEEKPYTICFLDGNHEGFDVLFKYPVETWNGGKVHVIRRNGKGDPKIIHLMRGQVFTVYGKKIFTFGGGYSIDKEYRLINDSSTGRVSWWPREMPSEEEMDEGMRNLEANDFKVDYILTHTAPESTMRYFHPDHVNEAPLNEYLEKVRLTTEYKRWFFGHLHQDRAWFGNQRLLWFDVVDMETGKIMEDE